jgi:hypothetical protein
MSHFRKIKTRFQNLGYLVKALNLLNIGYQKYQKLEGSNENLIIEQSNNSNIEFAWNKNQYELVVDISFWAQPCTIENFMAKIANKYSKESIIVEAQKTGFESVEQIPNLDGSNTLVFERWGS